MIQLRRAWAATLLTSMLAAGLASAETVEIVCDRDNTLYESSTGALSNGKGIGLFAGTTGAGTTTRAVLHFPVGDAVPAGATIHSAVLRLHLSMRQSGTRSFGLHRLLADWGEGTSDATGGEGGGAPSTPGDATWIHSFFPNTFWSGPGGDFDEAASATTSASDTGYVQWGSTADMIADVTSWLEQPSSNFGWLIRGPETLFTGQRFDSREIASAWYRPRLIVDYTATVAAEPRAPRASLRIVGAQPASTAMFEVAVPHAGPIRVDILNVRGERVRSLAATLGAAGSERLTWDGRTERGADAPSGVYFARLVSGSTEARVRFTRLR